MPIIGIPLDTSEKEELSQRMEEQQTMANAMALALVDNLVPIVLSVDHEGFSLGMDIDSMVKQVERLIIKQQVFVSEQKPTEVDIGFHWTNSHNVESIRLHGLMTSAELEDREILVKKNGSSYGDGIYTGDDPASFCRSYGSACFLVARLQGEQATDRWRNVDTVTPRDKKMRVLKNSSQCVPLMCFHRNMLIYHRKRIFPCHIELQKLLDTFLNEGGDGTSNAHTWAKYVGLRYVGLQKLASQDDPKPLLPLDKPPSQKNGKSPIGVFAKPGKMNPFRKHKSEEAKSREEARG